MSFRTLRLELMTFLPELNAVQAGLRLNQSYQHLLDHHPWSFLHQDYLIYTVAPYTTGTITTTQGSATVTGTGTVWTTAMEGRYFRGNSNFEFYLIDDVDIALQTLTLNQVWGTTALAGDPYTIFQHRYAKPTYCKHVISLRRNVNMAERTLLYVDTMEPDRSTTGEPQYYINVDDDHIEVWPVPDSIYVLRMRYRLAIADLSAETDVALLPERVLLAHARMSSYLQLASNAEKAAHYLQLYQVAKADFDQYFTTAVEEDMRKVSLPTRVRAVGDTDLPDYNDFLLRHDVGDPRGDY